MAYKMSFKNTLAVVALLLTTLMAADLTFAQRVDIPSSRFRYKSLESPTATAPMAEPGVFNYDAQMFAPLEFTNNKEIEPNCGFFFTIDKVYVDIARSGEIRDTTPNLQNPVGSGFNWGTRYNLGWMNESERGWGMSYQNVEGSFFTAGQDVLVPNPFLITNKFHTFELNRIFRQSLSSGGYWEPYVGVRYTGISDTSIHDTTVAVVNGVPTFNRFKQKASNSLVGLQAGGRYNIRRGRYRMTFDAALATSYNQQRYTASDIATQLATIGVSERYHSDQSFVPTLDLELEFAYNITRDIAFRTGIMTNYMWNGINRVNALPTPLNPNSAFGAAGVAGILENNFVASGFTFGFEWHR